MSNEANYIEQGEEIVLLMKLINTKVKYMSEWCVKDEDLLCAINRIKIQKEMLDLDNRIEYLKSLIK